jgi:hypothetical protein
MVKELLDYLSESKYEMGVLEIKTRLTFMSLAKFFRKACNSFFFSLGTSRGVLAEGTKDDSFWRDVRIEGKE